MHSSVTDCSDVMLTVVLLLLEYFFHSAFSVQLFSGNKELDPVCSSHCCQQEETHGLRHAQYHLYTCICVVFSPLCSVPPQVCGRWVFFLNLPSTLRSFQFWCRLLYCKLLGKNTAFIKSLGKLVAYPPDQISFQTVPSDDYLQ